MRAYLEHSGVTLYQGDVREVLRGLPDESVNCCVTSPPYWGLRDYGCDGQIGLEATPDAYVAEMVAVFREVRRVLKSDGTLWLNLGDSYSSGGRDSFGTWSPDSKQATHTAIKEAKRPGQPVGIKPKDLIGIPWLVAFALRADGWYLRSDIIWHKPNPMPESVTDRPTKAHEYLFLMSKSERYHYNADAVAEAALEESASRYEYAFSGSPDGSVICPGDGEGQRTRPEGIREFSGKRNRRSVWTVTTQPYSGAHFATFPPKLIEPCILAGCPDGGTVLDPFFGAGTTGVVARQQEYCAIAARRLEQGNLFATEGK